MESAAAKEIKKMIMQFEISIIRNGSRTLNKIKINSDHVIPERPNFETHKFSFRNENKVIWKSRSGNDRLYEKHMVYVRQD